jgi:uncharacterized protein
MLFLVSDNESVDHTANNVGSLLLQLQGLDTASDQARHRKANLEERDHLKLVATTVVEWERQCTSLAAQIQQCEQEIAAAEERSGTIDTKRTRLQEQLKTVIAPREAEALQHEIATLDEERSVLDEATLVKMAEQSVAENELASLKAQEGDLRQQASNATAAVADVEASIDAGLTELASKREQLVSSLPSALVTRYEHVRAKLGVAAAMLTGSRCEGCHLDLSPAEVDEIRRAPADALPDCPQCGRLLVR